MVKKTKIWVTSLVFGNFSFDYYSYRFGLGFSLGFELGLGLGLVLLGFITKCLHARNMRQAFSKNNWPTGSLFIGYEKGDKHELICDITCADNIKQNFKVKH